MSLKQSFCDKVFAGRQDMLDHITSAAIVPVHNADQVGVLYQRSVNLDCYIATDTAGTWVKLNA